LQRDCRVLEAVSHSGGAEHDAGIRRHGYCPIAPSASDVELVSHHCRAEVAQKDCCRIVLRQECCDRQAVSGCEGKKPPSRAGGELAPHRRQKPGWTGSQQGRARLKLLGEQRSDRSVVDNGRCARLSSIEARLHLARIGITNQPRTRVGEGSTGHEPSVDCDASGHSVVAHRKLGKLGCGALGLGIPAAGNDRHPAAVDQRCVLEGAEQLQG